MLLQNNTCCFCCRKLLILSTSKKNWRHKGKYNFLGGLVQKFRQKFLPEGLPLICCQFVILFKSATWQHMWSSKSICKKYRNLRFFEFFGSESWFSLELSVCVHAAIIVAKSNIASLLPIFNKNVVFQQQMLFFDVCAGSSK